MPTAIRHTLSFILNDRTVTLDHVTATQTLLDYLRLDAHLCGTKEGCNEGDCGACTVLVGRLMNGQLRYETANACIRFMGSLDASHVVTVEHLSGADGGLHPVQKALVAEHGSQCGFCTPGIVMSLYALWMENKTPSKTDIERTLQGNLCRCTGYAPIVRAGLSMGTDTRSSNDDRLKTERDQIVTWLKEMQDGTRIDLGDGSSRLLVPANLDDFASLYSNLPNATIVAGATDVALWVNKDFRNIAPVIFINHLDELKTIKHQAGHLIFGAGVSYTDALTALSEYHPTLSALWNRIGGEQVRNAGTLGGNIANGSPIGDTPPAFIALGATITLRRGDIRRTILLEDFFIDYGKQDRGEGEFVENIAIPDMPEDAHFAVYKISKRRDEDISALCGAFWVRVDEGMVRAVRIAFGGMAATPRRADAVEAALIGKPWTHETIDTARKAFDHDYQPLSDWRASAAYRMLTAKNLLTRFYLDTATDVQTALTCAPYEAAQ